MLNMMLFLELISSISNLEYLDLSYNGMLPSLPETIGKLSKLGTLDISYCYSLQKLPASISEINNLKLHVHGCWQLESTLHQYKNSATVLPYFVVHTGDGESSSNLSQLEYENPTDLEKIQLENVKSAEEAQRIKLAQKQRIQNLKLAWTGDAERFVDDKEVLKKLVPPNTLEYLTLQGYNSITYPPWIVDIAIYLPCLKEITLSDFPNCDNLPPLGQLPNLEELWIERMDSIIKIDNSFYGGAVAFTRLKSFWLHHMKYLEEWNTEYSNGQDGLNEFAFPILYFLSIQHCSKLRFKSFPPLGERMDITASPGVLLSS